MVPAMTRPALALAVLAICTGPAVAAPGPRILVVEAKPLVLPEPFEKVSLASEVEKKLVETGCPVAGICTAGDCSATAREAGATEVLLINAEYQRDRYSCAVHLEARGINGELKFGANYGGDSCPAA